MERKIVTIDWRLLKLRLALLPARTLYYIFITVPNRVEETIERIDHWLEQ